MLPYKGGRAGEVAPLAECESFSFALRMAWRVGMVFARQESGHVAMQHNSHSYFFSPVNTYMY